MRLVIAAIALYLGIIGFGFVYHGMPKPYPETNAASAIDDRVKFYPLSGSAECGRGICMPSSLRECIVATGECRIVKHPLYHPYEVTTCWDSVARQEIFFTAASRFCHA